MCACVRFPVSNKNLLTPSCVRLRRKQSAEIEALSTRMSDDTEISKEEAEREKASLVRKYENVQKRLECEVRLLKNRLTGERARSIKSTTKARDIQLEMK